MFSPIAIIGRSCLLPGAASPDQLWEVVRDRRTTISAPPEGRWRGSRERLLADRICASDAGGYVRGFDATGRTGGDVDESLDTAVHWLFHVARGALENAGIALENAGIALENAGIAEGRHHAGAIIGNLAYPTESLVDIAQSIFLPEVRGKRAHSINRFSAGYPVHLLCDRLGLNAGGYALDAACASSLYAIKLACDWLHSGRADFMLAGGINRVEGVQINGGFTSLTALSPTGQSRPFHRDADGLVPAEGAAMLVLKRLEDAEAAGDRILGVIRGVGLSNDGRGSGMLTPAAAGQVRAMNAAYAQCGLTPRDISLIECHATGTTVGDAIELHSMSEVFRGLRDVPIGSLKSNLGHLITASGAAGIIKVLEALKHDRRPATINAFPSNEALAGTPFRLLQEEEPWERSAGSPRRAAISSFGFGGNNAHLLIEEFTPGLSASAKRGRAPRRVAVVGMAVRAADGESTEAFESAFLSGSTRICQQRDGTTGASAQEVRLPSNGLIFPPRDLERTLAQQTLLLEVAGEAMESAVGLCRERTSALIGMSCDAETTRSILRAVLPDLLPVEEIGHIALAQREAAMDVGFDAARVVGCMPNIPANRLNRQFDLGGASFTLAAEELSGIRALEIAVDALVANEIDAAIVGASDMCVEPVHRSAVPELPDDRRIPGDGACVLILKRVETAILDRDRIRSMLDLSPDGEAMGDSNIGPRLRDCFGHIHAMSGLFEVAAATVLMDRRIEFNSQGECVPVLPDSEVRPIRLRIDALGGQSAVVQVGPVEGPLVARATIVGAAPDIYTYAAADIAGLIRALDSGQLCKPGLTDPHQHRLSIVAAADDLRERLRLARGFLNRVDAGEISDSMSPEGIFFRRSAVEGDLAFVFTGGSAAYTGMGRGLLLAMPQLDPGPSKADWAYRSLPEQPPSDFQRLCGSSFLCQVHARFTQEILGLCPQAAIGLSSGETNSMYALGAWQGMEGLLHDIEECGLYTNLLGGRADAIREDWIGRGIEGEGGWSNYWILAPLDEVEAAVALEASVHITIINTQNDVVIGGDSSACQRIAERIGTRRCSPLGGDFAAHCPEVRRVADLWRRLHRRPTIQPQGITYYSNALGRSYQLTDDSVADALTMQAIDTVDFPRTIQTAWNDGVRIFVEHGPRSQCTQSIRSILAGRPFVAVPLDIASRPSLTQALYAAAELWTAGVEVDIDGLRSAIGLDRPPATERKDILRLPAHPIAPGVVVMTPAPKLALLAEADEVAADLPTPESVSGAQTVMALHAQISVTHQEHLRQMARLDQAYQETQGRLLQLIGGGAVEAAQQKTRSFTRQQLEIHASGRISEIFGPGFAAQDGFVRQVRMPEPPLLLADRVTSLTGEPGSMGMGSITTETDIVPGAWYLHHGRMPAGIMVEAGQADLMLISWLGVDKHNKGQRVYRLLGCELSFHGELPRPGETLRYEIKVASHAEHGGVRIFFFDYDCTSGGKARLSVRNGHAGFFTLEELAGSEGVLWSAATGAHTPAEQARLDPAPCLTSRRSFGPGEVQALAAGKVVECFGDGFELAYTHSRTPVAQFGQMQFLERIPVFDPGGGPWKRGYLRGEWDVRPDEWFFKGHFKNDPCMPGTLMVEGCLQAMAFYLSAQGFTLNRDGWRFEPVPDTRYSLRCRAQVLPSSTLLVYEVFVDAIIAGPTPTIYADVLCTVDGLTSCHCARLGLRLVPDWPLEETLPQASVGLPLDYQALLACALGRPSHAFGPAFARFDGAIRVPRLPGDPYHFLSRVVHAEQTETAAGSVAEIEYDVPSGAWYFSENGYAVMPVCVLVEVLLQPCGWLASFAGTWKKATQDTFFRNLDGGGTVHGEVGPTSGTLRTSVRLKSCSEMGAISITDFVITCHAGYRLIFEGYAVFGHFPADSLQNQTGLAPSEAELLLIRGESPEQLDIQASGIPPLGRGKLQVIDRISGYWPLGGQAGLGQLRSEFDVDPALWFFKAHFFGDPVQPGSLGLEAVAQTLQIWMIETGRCKGIHNPRFESIATGEALSWTFRGQVVPGNKRVTILMEILEARPAFAKAGASLWVDGKKIYSIASIAIRAVPSQSDDDNEESLDPAVDIWLKGHCPTYTIPALPMMSVVDRLAVAAQRLSGRGRVLEVHDAVLNGWITFPSGPRRIKTHAVLRDTDVFDVSLSVWRDAPHATLSRFETIATAVVKTGEEYPPRPEPIPALTDARPMPNIYATGELFHGSPFHNVQELVRSSSGSSFSIDSKRGSVPVGFLNQGLLDAALHGIPIENLRLCSDHIPADSAGYPTRIIRLSLFAEPPADGRSRCEVRFAGFHQEDLRFPRFIAQLTDAGGIWAELDLVYVLFPKGPIGRAPAADRRDFLMFRKFVPGMELGSAVNEETVLTAADLYENDWLPGTVDSAFSLRNADRVAELAMKQHIARQTQVHPAEIVVSEGGEAAIPKRYPLNRFPLAVSRDGDLVRVRSLPPRLDFSMVREFWGRLNGVTDWPIADLHIGLLERFIRRIEFTDPETLGNIRGTPALFLANHQVAIESTLFIVAISALCDLPVKVIAKTEHQLGWVGRLIELAKTYAGFHGPESISFFDRNDPGALLKVLADFGGSLAQTPASLMVHVDGTRSLSCRKPVSQISSVLLEMAIERNLPVVPVRFVGGLPSTPVEKRLEIPSGGGQQDIRIGRAISPQTLREHPMAERSRIVLHAINSLAIPDEESFGTGPADFSLRQSFVDALRFASYRCSESEELLSALDSADVDWGGRGRGNWLRAAKSWFDSLDD